MIRADITAVALVYLLMLLGSVIKCQALNQMVMSLAVMKASDMVVHKKRINFDTGINANT